MTRNQEIAQTILQQLGGNRFAVMTGAKNFVAIDNGLRFQIGRNATRANCVKVILDWDDTYTMQFWCKGREVNPYTIMMKYMNKGLTEQQFNDTVQKAIEKSTKSAEPKMLKEYTGLFFDQLQEFFTEFTHMYTKL